MPGALGYGGTPEEARLSSMRAILPIIKAREKQKAAQLAEARADADALAGALKTGPSGKLVALGWSKVDGEEKFRAVIVFEEAPYGLGLKLSDVWEQTPVKILTAQALASRPGAARKRAEGQA